MIRARRLQRILRPRPPLLLDGVPGLYAVLSLKKLVSSYAGPLVQATRAYDETTLDLYPDQTGWVSADEIKQFGGGRTVYCSKIYDQTGNGRHAATTTTPTQSHTGMMAATFDLSGKYPCLFFGAQAPGQAYEVLLSTGWLQNITEAGAAIVARSIYNISTNNKNMLSVVNNAAATRFQMSVGFSTTQFSSGGRRLDANSFDNLDGPTYDSNWHVFVGRPQYGSAVNTLNVDDVEAIDSSFQTAGSTSNTASATTVNIGMGVSRQGGFFGGQMTAVILLTKGDFSVARLARKLRPLIPHGANRSLTVGHSHTLTSLFTTTNGGQGLCGNQTNFWIGKSNGDGVASTIYKVTYAGAAVTNFSGIVSHAQSVFLRTDNGTLVVGDYDTTGANPPVFQEMNATTGAAVRSWTFTGVGYAKAPTGCYYGAGQLLLITHPDMVFTGAPHVSLVTIDDAGTFTVNNSWRFPVCLGQMQGCVYKDGFLYVIVDDNVVNASHHNGTIYKCRLDGGANDDSGTGTVAIIDRFPQMRAQGGEQEGLTWDGLKWYQITNADGTTIRVHELAGIT